MSGRRRRDDLMNDEWKYEEVETETSKDSDHMEKVVLTTNFKMCCVKSTVGEINLN